MKNILEVKNICKTYQAKNGEIEALKDINFKIEEGEYVSIIGPSGCGKSTLLSIIAGLENKTSGTTYINGCSSSGSLLHIGYMLQKDNLLEWRTVLNNVFLGLEIQRSNTPENKKYAIELLKKYGLYEFKDKYPNQLSGGMRQRVALIRTLAIKPKILLLDEAFSALDYQTRLMVTEDIYKILKNEGITALMVTHDISEAIAMSDKIIVLTHRPAKIKAVHEIDFEIKNRTPLNCRQSPKFSKYFDMMWSELNEKETKEKNNIFKMFVFTIMLFLIGVFNVKADFTIDFSNSDNREIASNELFTSKYKTHYRVTTNGDVVYCYQPYVDYAYEGGTDVKFVFTSCSNVSTNAAQLAYVYANGYGGTNDYSTGGTKFDDYYATQLAVWYFGDRTLYPPHTVDFLSNFNVSNGRLTGNYNGSSNKTSEMAAKLMMLMIQ